jgi:hypothetical protein
MSRFLCVRNLSLLFQGFCYMQAKQVDSGKMKKEGHLGLRLSQRPWPACVTRAPTRGHGWDKIPAYPFSDTQTNEGSGEAHLRWRRGIAAPRTLSAT